jgi:hypothetical protein
MSVLIVDDTASQLSLLTSVLRRAGYRDLCMAISAQAQRQPGPRCEHGDATPLLHGRYPRRGCPHVPLGVVPSC